MTRPNAEVFHDGVMDRARGVVEEYIDPLRACLLDGGREVGGLFVVDDRVVTDLAAPLQLVVVSGDRHRATAGQFGELTDKLADGT